MTAMLTRANGLALTSRAQADADALDAVEAALLRYGKEVADYLASPAPHGDSAYGVAMAAALHLMALTAPGRARALPLVARAERLAAGTTPHEQLFVGAVVAWARGNLNGAIARHMIIAERWPRDLLSVKIMHFHQINTGDFAGMLASMQPVVAAQPGLGYVHGMHAFALEQCGDARGAERAGRRAADMGNDPWAHHAVAHVLDTAGRAREGRAWLSGKAAGWDDCSSFMYTHNWWHAALFELALGDHDAALALYDARVWGVRRDCVQDQLNAVSLLARLELRGVDAGSRWTDLAPHLALRIADRANPFVDLHLAYGLARAGADAPLADLCSAVADRAGAGPVEAVADRFTRGVVACARHRFADAASAFAAAGSETLRLGGSHTQRRLIDLLAADARGRAGGWGRVVTGRFGRTVVPATAVACAA